MSDIVIDNPQATVAGTWSTGTASTDKFGEDYRYNGPGSGNEYLQFVPNILVAGDYAGVWKHIPKNLNIAVWGGPPREKSLKFFAEQGFRTLVACYYDANDLIQVKGWLDLARPLPNVRGFMYTPWRKKYELLPAFGDLLQGGR